MANGLFFRQRPRALELLWVVTLLAGCDAVLGIHDHPFVPSVEPEAGTSDAKLPVDAPRGVCAPGAGRCAGNAVETCQPNGQWGKAVECFGTSALCSGGTCAANVGANCTAGAGVMSCGAADESCCTPTSVPTGSFMRTYTNNGSGPMGESDPATVSAFVLDKYLVTVGRFRQFVSAWNAGWRPPAGSGKHGDLNGGNGLLAVGGDAGGTFEPGWIDPGPGNILTADSMDCNEDATWTPTPGTQEGFPMNCINWWESYAFCIWDGGFLPTEAEWEYAAAGGDEERQYPWGSVDPGQDNLYAIYGCLYPDGSMSCGGLANLAPVGTPTLGKARWGELDMVGEVSVWALDWFANYVVRCTNCANLVTSGGRATRGGPYNLPEGLLVPTQRQLIDPSSRLSFLGARCARSP
jgi:formylglycine-generating enzyme